MTGSEHLAWCKKRAIEYLDNGDVAQAYASFSSDMNKHPETENHSALQLGMMLMVNGDLGTVPEMEKFINGFN